MPETFQSSYHSIVDMERPSVSWKKFFVMVEGRTNGAHSDFVTKLKNIGHWEVTSIEESDYLVVFCPIASRVGTDISEALMSVPDNKPTILVVMHHTYNRDLTIADSRRAVEKPNVCLTVDSLFHEGKALNCKRNNIAWSEIQMFLGVPPSQVSICDQFCNWISNNRMLAALCLCVVMALVIGLSVGLSGKNKE